jgi:tetratricopeptide (TPR) repeat protein
MKLIISKKRLLFLLFAGIFLTCGSIYAQCRIEPEDKGVYEQLKFSMNNGVWGDAKIRGKILITKYGDNCPDLYYDIGWVSFKTESWWDAIDLLKLALSRMSYDRYKYEFAYSAVGISYYESGYHKEAITYLDAAINTSAKADYYKYRGLAYYNLEDYQNAMNDFQTAKKYGSEFNDTESDFFWDASSKLDDLPGHNKNQ